MAEWLRGGLQNRLPRFNSGRGLHLSNAGPEHEAIMAGGDNMGTKFRIASLVLAFGTMSGLPIAFAAEAEPGRVFPIAGNIHLAVVEGRNTPFLVGDDAVLLAETNFERNAEIVRDLIATITPNPVRLAVNSHWHPDHVGGNAFFAANGALTLAHENTRTRMLNRLQNQATGPQSAEVISARAPRPPVPCSARALLKHLSILTNIL